MSNPYTPNLVITNIIISFFCSPFLLASILGPSLYTLPNSLHFQEKRVAEQEMERLAKQACASKETEMVRLEQQCDQALKEVENLRRKRDCMPEEESRLKDMLASREERLNKHTNRKFVQLSTLI